jgi:hypothetical protein
MVGDRETHVVRGRSSKEIAERLFFDTKTGLLLRRVVLTNTVLGPLPDQTDYDDYREVDGVRLPFLVRRFDRARVTTTKVSSVKHGVELGDAEFEPAPPPKQTGEN